MRVTVWEGLLLFSLTMYIPMLLHEDLAGCWKDDTRIRRYKEYMHSQMS